MDLGFMPFKFFGGFDELPVNQPLSIAIYVDKSLFISFSFLVAFSTYNTAISENILLISSFFC